MPWEYFLQSCFVQADVSEADPVSVSKQTEKFVFAALYIWCRFSCINKNTINLIDIQSSLVVHYSEREDKRFSLGYFPTELHSERNLAVCNSR